MLSRRTNTCFQWWLFAEASAKSHLMTLSAISTTTPQLPPHTPPPPAPLPLHSTIDQSFLNTPSQMWCVLCNTNHKILGLSTIPSEKGSCVKIRPVSIWINFIPRENVICLSNLWLVLMHRVLGILDPPPELSLKTPLSIHSPEALSSGFLMI